MSVPEPMRDHDQNLPSGRWVGFYVYPYDKSRHRMDLRLEVTPDRISGTGIDPIGRFVISGRIHEDRKVNWVKTYLGRHDVQYEGFADHNGIWGTWQIPPYTNGGFRIWPVAWGEGLARELEESTPIDPQETVPDLVNVDPAARLHLKIELRRKNLDVPREELWRFG